MRPETTTVEDLLTKRAAFTVGGVTITRSQAVALMLHADQIVPTYARTTVQSERALVRLGLLEGEPLPYGLSRLTVTEVGKAWLATFNPTPTLRCMWAYGCGHPATGTTLHPILEPVPSCDRHHHFATGAWRHTCSRCGRDIMPGAWLAEDRRVISHWVRAPFVAERRGECDHAPVFRADVWHEPSDRRK